jgi:Fe-S oxidoreductase
MNVPTVAGLFAEGKSPEILFWVGCAGSFDQRAQKITRAFVTILNKININFAILGQEEMCNGDPVRRAGNEFMFQMMAYQNIQVLNNYGIKKIVTTCPHCFNTLKNEYPELGGNYEVIHHTSFLQQLIDEGKIKMK